MKIINFVLLFANLEAINIRQLGKLEITQATHLWNEDVDRWRSFENKLARLQGIPTGLADLVLHFIVEVQEAKGITNNKTLDPGLWKWSKNMPTDGGFTISNKLAFELILGKFTEWQRLHERWNPSKKDGKRDGKSCRDQM